MIQVYTGQGKGKTTAAIGAALRALGHGQRVLLIQFMKKGRDYGEIKAARHLKGFKILQFGTKKWVSKTKINLKDKQLARKGWQEAQKAIRSKRYELVILDELNVALDFGLVKAQKVKETLKNSPKNLEIIITGRGAPLEILEVADLVTEMKELKHYYSRGLAARPGIEY